MRRMKRTTPYLIGVLALLFSGMSAYSELLDVSDTGFVSVTELQLDTTPAIAYSAFLKDVGIW